MVIPDELRTSRPAIATRWEQEVLREVPALAVLPRAALIDHLPELLDGLASWVEGDTASTVDGFRALAAGHAVQRHGAGIELETVAAEYATLRRVILEHLHARVEPVELAAAVVRIDTGIDRAIGEAARRYSAARDHVRERFIGVLAHDLRDPLTAVMMSATLLRDTTLGDKQAQLVERLARGAHRIERMIDDVLDFAGGSIAIVPALANLGELCSEAIDEARALEPGIEIELDASGELHGMLDRERVRQALANLISNARHYGTGWIRVRVWEREDRHALLTAVSNQGAAIPLDTLAHIFDPFSRSTEGSKRRGLGFGLYIVEQIAKAHAGTCRAVSEGETTTFTIEWPRPPPEP